MGRTRKSSGILPTLSPWLPVDRVLDKPIQNDHLTQKMRTFFFPGLSPVCTGAGYPAETQHMAHRLSLPNHEPQSEKSVKPFKLPPGKDTLSKVIQEIGMLNPTHGSLEEPGSLVPRPLSLRKVRHGNSTRLTLTRALPASVGSPFSGCLELWRGSSLLLLLARPHPFPVLVARQ